MTPSDCFMPECPEESITLVIGSNDEDEGIVVGGLCQGHFDSIVKTDDNGRTIFTGDAARVESIEVEYDDGSVERIGADFYQYTEAEALAEDWSAEGRPGHDPGCTTYRECMAGGCGCGCHD